MLPENWKTRLRQALGTEKEAGQALVETALAVPLLSLMLLGAFEFGRVAYMGIELSNAAKAAVQYGSQSQITANDQTGMQAIAQADASALPAGSVSVSVSSTCSCSSPYTNSPTFSCATATATSCTSPSHIEQTITVSASAPFNPVLQVGGLGGPFTLTALAVQKRLE